MSVAVKNGAMMADPAGPDRHGLMAVKGASAQSRQETTGERSDSLTAPRGGKKPRAQLLRDKVLILR
jgi:hypothetical protein